MLIPSDTKYLVKFQRGYFVELRGNWILPFHLFVCSFLYLVQLLFPSDSQSTDRFCVTCTFGIICVKTATDFYCNQNVPVFYKIKSMITNVDFLNLNAYVSILLTFNDKKKYNQFVLTYVDCL